MGSRDDWSMRTVLGPALQVCGRACRLSWCAARLGLIEFYNSNNLTFAASIAYYTLLSIFPFLLLVLLVLSRVSVGDGHSDQTLLDLLGGALPSRFEVLGAQLRELARSPLNLGLAGTAPTS